VHAPQPGIHENQPLEILEPEDLAVGGPSARGWRVAFPIRGATPCLAAGLRCRTMGRGVAGSFFALHGSVDLDGIRRGAYVAELDERGPGDRRLAAKFDRRSSRASWRRRCHHHGEYGEDERSAPVESEESPNADHDLNELLHSLLLESETIWCPRSASRH